jgi:Na+-transporting NADH:ubiquinone oxidoreductase subunit NqrE
VKQLVWVWALSPVSFNGDIYNNWEWQIGVDIQLKILQALPPLLQNYPRDLHGVLLGEALLICAILQGSKMGVVNNTAAASTLVFKFVCGLNWRC